MIKKLIFSLGLLMLCLTLIGCTGAPAPTAIPMPLPPQATPGAPDIPHTHIPFLSFGTWQSDIVYCQDGDVALKMDVFYPDVLKEASAPLAVFLHMFEGDKNQVNVEVVEELLKRGYIIAAPNWRQPPDFKYPLGIGDAKCAIRYLRAYASLYHIDADHVGVWGCSMGGYAAALLAVTPTGAGLEGNGGYADQSSQVQAVVSRDGVANMQTALMSKADLQELLGISSFEDPILTKISPVTYISKDAPPFLIFQSDSDSGSRGQNKELFDKLTAVGASVRLVEIIGSDHCSPFGNPSREERAKMIGDFFDQNLK